MKKVGTRLEEVFQIGELRFVVEVVVQEVGGEQIETVKESLETRQGLGLNSQKRKIFTRSNSNWSRELRK